MQKLAFAYPIKPGQFERLIRHQQEVIAAAGEHLSHADDIRLSCVRMYHQTQPIEAVIIYMEGEDIADAVDRSKHGGKPAHDLWADFWEDITDDHAPGAMPSVILDWHRESGHAVRAG